MSAYTEYFLNCRANIIQYETLEVSHPSFSQTFYVVRNNTAGITATIHYTGGSSVVDFVYYPLKISLDSTRTDLDQVVIVEIGDLGELLPAQIANVTAASTFNVKPTLKYRTYRSDVLTTELYGPFTLEITALAFKKEGAAFEARAPLLNLNETGEIYNIDRFPMLRGFL